METFIAILLYTFQKFQTNKPFNRFMLLFNNILYNCKDLLRWPTGTRKVQYCRSPFFVDQFSYFNRWQTPRSLKSYTTEFISMAYYNFIDTNNIFRNKLATQKFNFIE